MSESSKFFEQLLQGAGNTAANTPPRNKPNPNTTKDRLSLGSDNGTYTPDSPAESVDLLAMNEASPKPVVRKGPETLEEKIARVMGQIHGGSKPKPATTTVVGEQKKESTTTSLKSSQSLDNIPGTSLTSSIINNKDTTNDNTSVNDNSNASQASPSKNNKSGATKGTQRNSSSNSNGSHSELSPSSVENNKDKEKVETVKEPITTTTTEEKSTIEESAEEEAQKHMDEILSASGNTKIKFTSNDDHNKNRSSSSSSSSSSSTKQEELDLKDKIGQGEERVREKNQDQNETETETETPIQDQQQRDEKKQQKQKQKPAVEENSKQRSKALVTMTSSSSSSSSVSTEQESQDKRRALRKALRAAYHGQDMHTITSDGSASKTKVNLVDTLTGTETEKEKEKEDEDKAIETNKSNENNCSRNTNVNEFSPNRRNVQSQRQKLRSLTRSDMSMVDPSLGGLKIADPRPKRVATHDRTFSMEKHGEAHCLFNEVEQRQHDLHDLPHHEMHLIEKEHTVRLDELGSPLVVKSDKSKTTTSTDSQVFYTSSQPPSSPIAASHQTSKISLSSEHKTNEWSLQQRMTGLDRTAASKDTLTTGDADGIIGASDNSANARANDRKMCSVRVAVRVRPFNFGELREKAQRILTIANSNDQSSSRSEEGGDASAEERVEIILSNPKLFDVSNMKAEALATYASRTPHADCIKTFKVDKCLWSFRGTPERPIPSQLQCASQEDVFEDIGRELVDKVLSGISTTCFAYGHTSTGKTHSMFGSLVLMAQQAVEASKRKHPHEQSSTTASGSEENVTGGGPSSSSTAPLLTPVRDDGSLDPDLGLIPRTVAAIVEGVLADPAMRHDTRVTLSFKDIYNNRIRDLLMNSDPDKHLKVREHPQYGTFVEGLTKVEVGSVGEALQVLLWGATRRTIATTARNLKSSRSHAIVTVELSPRAATGAAMQPKGQGKSNNIQATLHTRGSSTRIHLLDLAGSEEDQNNVGGSYGNPHRKHSVNASRVHVSVQERDLQRTEMRTIRKSLSTLGFIIREVARGAPMKGLPFGDSVLTRLLKDMLIGRSHITMLATISPAHICFEETFATLKYAQRISDSGLAHPPRQRSSKGIQALDLSLEEGDIRSKGGLTRSILRQSGGDPQQRLAHMTPNGRNRASSRDRARVRSASGSVGSLPPRRKAFAVPGPSGGARVDRDPISMSSSFGSSRGSQGSPIHDSHSRISTRSPTLRKAGRVPSQTKIASSSSSSSSEPKSEGLMARLAEMELELANVRTDRDALVLELHGLKGKGEKIPDQDNPLSLQDLNGNNGDTNELQKVKQILKDTQATLAEWKEKYEIDTRHLQQQAANSESQMTDSLETVALTKSEVQQLRAELKVARSESVSFKEEAMRLREELKKSTKDREIDQVNAKEDTEDLMKAVAELKKYATDDNLQLKNELQKARGEITRLSRELSIVDRELLSAIGPSGSPLQPLQKSTARAASRFQQTQQRGRTTINKRK